MKRIFLLFLCGFLCAANISAQTWDCGAQGNNVTATLSGSPGNYTLTISGTGEMANYVDFGYAPWYASHDTSIKSVIIESGVTTIGNFAFYFCMGLTSITIPDGVTTIGRLAFMYCESLSSITIPESVTTIGEWAFFGCMGLTSVTIPDGVTTIDYATFSSCTGLTSISIPESVTTIGTWAFASCTGLTSIIIPENVTTFGDGVFAGCTGLTSIPENLTTIGRGMFNDCTGLTFVTIPEGVTSIGEWAFASCTGLKSVIIHENVTSIGGWAFSDCWSLTSITIPENVTSIGEQAFYCCTGLTSITILNGVTTIGNRTFAHCTGLASITTHAVIPPTLGYQAFYDVSETIPVYIPCFTYDKYKANWYYFSNIIINGTVSDTTFYSVKRCWGVPYTDNNFTEPIIEVGTYYRTLANNLGCDSVVCLTLSQYEPVNTHYYQALICRGDTYNDQNFTGLIDAGSYQTTHQNINGCDSIVFLQLSLTNSPEQELCMISVDLEYHNQIVWKRQEEITAYNIYREGNVMGQYVLVATIPYEAANNWTDMESNARVRSYSYKVSGIDTCGNESVLSAMHKTMHLTINQGIGSWNLIWTPYEGTGYSTYNIYRAVGETFGELTLIGTMPSSNSSFTDFTSTGSGYVYYMIEIVLNNTCDGSVVPVQSAASKTVNSEPSFGAIRSNIATNNPDGLSGTPTGFKIRDAENTVKVYPNPFIGEVHITGADGYMLRVINSAGVEIYIQMINTTDETVRMEHLPAGVYFFRFEKDEQTIMVKTVKN